MGRNTNRNLIKRKRTQKAKKLRKALEKQQERLKKKKG
jgi:hypothetical protein